MNCWLAPSDAVPSAPRSVVGFPRIRLPIRASVPARQGFIELAHSVSFEWIMLRTTEYGTNGPVGARHTALVDSRVILPDDHQRFCSVRVLIPGKRIADLVRMRWSGEEWLLSDGLRLSHANLVLSWSYL